MADGTWGAYRWDGNACKIVAHIPSSWETLDDYQLNLADRCFRPWLFPDRNPMPVITTSPLLARIASTLGEATRRVVGAWTLLCEGHTYGDGWDD